VGLVPWRTMTMLYDNVSKHCSLHFGIHLGPCKVYLISFEPAVVIEI